MACRMLIGPVISEAGGRSWLSVSSWGILVKGREYSYVALKPRAAQRAAAMISAPPTK